MAGLTVLLLGCLSGLALAPTTAFATSPDQTRSDKLDVAEKMLDAFYAFERPALTSLLEPGADADRVMYYQAWAEAANYQIKDRQPCAIDDEDMIVCAITVFDDFGKTLDYIATDTFYLAVQDGKVTSAVFEGDDPFIFKVLFVWMTLFRPEVLEGPCKDMFAGGNTPAACARGVVEAARDFTAIF